MGLLEFFRCYQFLTGSTYKKAKIKVLGQLIHFAIQNDTLQCDLRLVKNESEVVIPLNMITMLIVTVALVLFMFFMDG